MTWKNVEALEIEAELPYCSFAVFVVVVVVFL